MIILRALINGAVSMKCYDKTAKINILMLEVVSIHVRRWFREQSCLFINELFTIKGVVAETSEQ